jgi:hypothetical protein
MLARQVWLLGVLKLRCPQLTKNAPLGCIQALLMQEIAMFSGTTNSMALYKECITAQTGGVIAV